MESDKILENGVRVIKGKNILPSIGDYLKEIEIYGNICVIYSKKYIDIADKVIKCLANIGYHVYTLEIESVTQKVDECVRYCIGIGDKDASDYVKSFAKNREIAYSLIPVAPSTESYIYPYVNIDFEMVECDYPDIIFWDEDVISHAQDRQIASGYGRVIAQLVSIFDIEFRREVFAEKPDEVSLFELTDCIHKFEICKEDGNFAQSLMDVLLKIGCIKIKQSFEHEAVDEVSRVLNVCSNISEGEASFIATFMILNIYKIFLQTDCIDTLIPEDISSNIKLLEKMRVINYNKYISSISVFDLSKYMKETFVLSEYRADLLRRIEDIDLGSFAKFWRRLYDDAGFWLKTYLSGQELMRYLAVASELSEGTLLKYIKRIGFFEKLI